MAVQLATRYEACQILEPSIALMRFTLRQVELVLERDDDEWPCLQVVVQFAFAVGLLSIVRSCHNFLSHKPGMICDTLAS